MNLPATQYLGCLAYEAGQRVAKQKPANSRATSILSARQLECIALVARGKTDWEIGSLLSISPETAHKHIQAAMRRLGVTTRTQMVVRALFERQVRFRDVIA